jgi:hypothetical protein
MYDLERELIAELPARYETDTVTIDFSGATVANSANVTQGNLGMQGGGHSVSSGNANANGFGATGGTSTAAAGDSLTQSNWSKICQNIKLNIHVRQ